jgi:hypothetical protein
MQHRSHRPVGDKDRILQSFVEVLNLHCSIVLFFAAPLALATTPWD